MRNVPPFRFHTFPAALIVLAILSGCATTNRKDPLEPMNRMVFAVNKAADTALIKPVATIYTRLTPQFLRTGLSNMVNNMRDVITVVNGTLQFKFGQAARDLERVVINTVFGAVGFFDLASRDGLTRNREDFGQTLAVWGVPSGPYLVLPLVGPSTFRDGVGVGVDIFLYPADLAHQRRARLEHRLRRNVRDPARRCARGAGVRERCGRGRILFRARGLDAATQEPHLGRQPAAGRPG